MNINEFFNEIDKDKIKEFVQRGQEEHLTLEFKTVITAGLTDKQDKKTFAKALSGFANSSGGVIVWGIVARKVKDVDRACGTEEIKPLSLFMSRLNELTGELVKPIVEGVQHKGIEVTSDKGFAVTLVPESNAGPHMAMGFEGRHYKRSGDSFYPMEHFDIEDMFGRRKKPKLSLCTEIKKAGRYSSSNGIRHTFHVMIGIKNAGRGIAKHVALEVGVNEPYSINPSIPHKPHGFEALTRPGSDKVLYSLGSDVVVHPKSSVSVVLVIVEFWERQQTIEDLMINAEIMAEDMQTVEEKVVIKGDEIRSKIMPENT